MKFLRQETNRHSKLGKKRKKLQKWRRPKGRDSKMRLKRRGHGASPSIGYKKPSKERGKIDGKKIIIVHNVDEMKKVKKKEIAIIANVGAKKKIEMIKIAKDKGIEVMNLGGKK